MTTKRSVPTEQHKTKKIKPTVAKKAAKKATKKAAKK
jgi:hypothetical protein